MEAPLPERRLGPREVEAVLRRAIELQAGGGGAPDLAERDLLRLGQELGLEPWALQRALAEIGPERVDGSAVLDRLLGPGWVGAERVVPEEADVLWFQSDTYWQRVAYLTPRRRGVRTAYYERASGLPAAVGRALRRWFGRGPHLEVTNVWVRVEPLGARESLVLVGTRLTGPRAGAAAGAGTASATALLVGGGLALLEPALGLAVGAPAAAGSWLIARAAYRAWARRRQADLETFLDLLAHGELPLPRRWP